MRAWARVADGVVRELTHTDPTDRFHASLTWISAPPDAQVGWIVHNNSIMPPPPVAPTAAQALAALRHEADLRRGAGVWFQPASASAPVLFATDRTGTDNLSACFLLVQAGQWTAGSAFNAADGSPHVLTAAEVTALATKAGVYILAVSNFATAQAAQVAANPSTDVKALPWPSNA